jgi:hypothetical protein
MNIYIFALASLAFVLAVTAAILCLLWKTRHDEKTIRQLKAFAESLPEDERAIFWRLHQNRALWNSSRYPRAFQKWKKRNFRAAIAPTEAEA